jgi:hypothetical protein
LDIFKGTGSTRKAPGGILCFSIEDLEDGDLDIWGFVYIGTYNNRIQDKGTFTWIFFVPTSYQKYK